MQVVCIARTLEIYLLNQNQKKRKEKKNSSQFLFYDSLNMTDLLLLSPINTYPYLDVKYTVQYFVSLASGMFNNELTVKYKNPKTALKLKPQI